LLSVFKETFREQGITNLEAILGGVRAARMRTWPSRVFGKERGKEGLLYNKGGPIKW